ncbi:hypothetical protein PBY51_004596 [Eleginops maclovinus]|uniref:Peptidase M12B domain-containing protein n=1 Tax=Eleginops maclovinus TaxID=56733 RepID=A0AAN7Y328_ELEMC|nr:hypothetical protein PBY51_004596 [Eleginops maclovinus]
MTALTLLLGILLLNASLQSSESDGRDFEEVKDYEVVRPVRLHTVRKRDTQDLRPETMKYAMRVGGRDIEMHLEKNNELLPKDYTETFYQDDGTRVTTTPTDIDHCYYHGSIVDDSQSSVSISTCDGLKGYFRTSAQRYLIEPLSGGDEGDHAVMTFDDKNFSPAVCGVTNTSWSEDFEPPTSRSRSRSAGHVLLMFGQRAGMGGIDFEGATVGLAFIGTLCSGHSVGVVQDHTSKAIAVGATLAHEMGHNLGMNHDDSSACHCSGRSCIMAPALSYDVPRTFSSCSSNFYENT